MPVDHYENFPVASFLLPRRLVPAVEAIYVFARSADGRQRLVRIDHHDPQGPLLQTSQSGRLDALSGASVRRAFFGVPLMTFGVMLRIHWQALRVWLKRVPFRKKPHPPQAFVTR